MQGQVLLYEPGRCFGFITPDESGSAPVFVHINDVVNTHILKGGDQVQFEIVSDPLRVGFEVILSPRATNVTVTELPKHGSAGSLR